MRKIVTLCGSTRFKKEFIEANSILTMRGYVVISLGVFGHADGIDISDSDKESLDDIHKQKIRMSDEILVIDVDGYIGKSTESEILYAAKLGKVVNYLSEGDLDRMVDPS